MLDLWGTQTPQFHVFQSGNQGSACARPSALCFQNKSAFLQVCERGILSYYSVFLFY